VRQTDCLVQCHFHRCSVGPSARERPKVEMARCQDWRAREMSLEGICGGGGGSDGAGKKAQTGGSQQRVDTGQEKKTTRWKKKMPG